jgi:hypothetical protein
MVRIIIVTAICYYHLLIHFLNVDWLIFLQITGENNGLSMRTFEINSQLQIDLRMRI